MDDLQLRRAVDAAEATAVPDGAFVDALHQRLLVEAGFVAPPRHGPVLGRARPSARMLLAAALVGLLMGGAVVAAAALLRTTPAPMPVPSPTTLVGLSLPLDSTGSLVTPRCGHATVRLTDGRVLVVGGWMAAPPDPAPSAPSPEPGYPPLVIAPTAEVYDPVSGVFRQVTGTTTGGDGVSATLLADGRVLIAGGRGPRVEDDPMASGCGYTTGEDQVPVPDEVADAYLYDPATDEIRPTGPLLTPRSGHVAVLLQDGRVLIAGGNGTRGDGSRGALASAERYVPSTGRFTDTGPMTTAHGWNRALGSQQHPWGVRLADGRVLVTGGIEDDPASFPVPAVEVYSPETGIFDVVNAVTPPDLLPTWIVTADNCFGPCLAQADPVSGTWSEGTRMTNDRVIGGSALVLIDDPVLGHRLLVAGGEGVTMVDLDAGREARALFAPEGFRRTPSATLLDDGRVLIVGGLDFANPVGRVVAEGVVAVPGP